MNTSGKDLQSEKPSILSRGKLSREEVFLTMDVFFDTMQDRGITQPLDLYKRAKSYAIETFGSSEELARILSTHKTIIELLSNPEVKEANMRVRNRKALSTKMMDGIKSLVSDIGLHTATKLDSSERKLITDTPDSIIPDTKRTQSEQKIGQKRDSYVDIPLESDSNLPSFDEAFRSGNMGLIDRLMRKFNVEEVSMQGWGKMTTLPPPVDFLAGKVVQPEDLRDLVNSYNKTANFISVNEIHRLQDGDVVNFKKLQHSLDGKNIQHFRIIKINEVKISNADYEIFCIANCVFIKKGVAYEVLNAQLRVRMPNTGLKQGTLLRVYTDTGEFFQSRIEGGMAVFTNDTKAFKGGFLSSPRFIS